MKKLLLFTAVLILSAGIVAASDTMPKNASSASRGCATATKEGTIADIDHAKGAFSLLGKTASPQTFFVTGDTKYRVPGVDKNVLKEDPLSNLSESSTAKVKFCKDTLRAVEVKVSKKK